MPNWLFFLQEKKIPQTKRMCSECCSNISAADRSWLSQLCLLRDGLEKPAGTNPGAAQQTPREQRCCLQLRFITFAAAADWWSRWVRDMGHRQSPQAGGSAYLLVLFCCACCVLSSLGLRYSGSRTCQPCTSRKPVVPKMSTRE